MTLPLLKNVPVPFLFFFIWRSHLFYRLNHVSPQSEAIRVRLTTRETEGDEIAVKLSHRCMRTSRREKNWESVFMQAEGYAELQNSQIVVQCGQEDMSTLYIDFITVVISHLCNRFLISDSMKRRVTLKENSDEIVTFIQDYRSVAYCVVPSLCLVSDVFRRQDLKET